MSDTEAAMNREEQRAETCGVHNMGKMKKPPKKPKRIYGITLDMAQDHLEEWMAAEMEITTHQSYRLRNQTLTMADLGEVRRQIQYWEGKVAELLARQNGGPRNRVYRVVPKDD